MIKRDQLVLFLSGMEKPDESSHLDKGIPAQRIVAQGDMQHLPTLITFLLSASAMDLSPNCMISFVLNGFIPASPCASSCAAAWHWNGRRLWAAPCHHNTILLLMELCCITACDEYPGGKKFKLILCCLLSPFWNSRISHRLLSPNTKCEIWEQLQCAVIRRGDLLWYCGWGFKCFSLQCFFGDKRTASSLLGPFLWIILSGCDGWSCGAQWSVWRWPVSEMISAPAACSPDVPDSGATAWHGHISTQFWNIYHTFDNRSTFILWMLYDSHFMKMHHYQSSGFTVEAGPLPALVPPYPLHSQKLAASITNFLGCQTATESQPSSR